MFRGTIWDNLVYGLPSSSPEQAIAAAKAAQSHEFILNSPLGYDTWLGERGAGLSGGERQRLSIARAILYDPPILVLDEATSSVDAESEQAIQQALKALTRGRTTIAIAHRLSTLRDAHRIMVFDRGRLAEQGSHDALLEQNGQYAKLVRLQSQVSPTASVDSMLKKADELRGETAAAAPAEEAQSFMPRWLTPDDALICPGPRETVTVVVNSPVLSPRRGGSGRGDEAAERLDTTITPPPARPRQEEVGREVVYRGVFAVNLFPATNPNDFISLRVWTRDGEQQEIGILRRLEDWPIESQMLVRHALDRRYFLQTIDGVESITLELGHLHCDVRTPHGPKRFTMRWSQSQVQDFGDRGKMLLDLDDNRFLVPDVDALPAKERELFQRFVYW
jgi:energy-coupling factor transporter ATP-binding protein EcfA2